MTENSPARPDWIDEYYAATDAKDMDRYLEFWSRDGRLVYGSREPAVGHEAIEQVARGVFEGFASTHHEVIEYWEPEPGVVIVEIRVTYERLDGAQVPVTGVLIGRAQPRRWLEQRIYVDIAPIFAAEAPATV
jgi:SnoaL-like domain